MLSVNEFILNKIETAVLNEDQSTYALSDIQIMISTAIEDYNFEYETSHSYSSSYLNEVKAMLNRMNITIQ